MRRYRELIARHMSLCGISNQLPFSILFHKNPSFTCSIKLQLARLNAVPTSPPPTSPPRVSLCYIIHRVCLRCLPSGSDLLAGGVGGVGAGDRKW